MNNEQGSVIVISLLILTLLTIIGISASRTTTGELQITGNEITHKRNFYRAEAAAYQAAQMLENATEDQLDDRSFNSFPWLKDADAADMSDTSTWDSLNSSGAVLDTATTKYSAEEQGIADRSSLDMTLPDNLYEYTLRGVSESNNGRSLIEIGYKKRH